jgi:hypothetical protein
MDTREENAAALARQPVCQTCQTERSCAIERRHEMITQVLCDGCATGGPAPAERRGITFGSGAWVPRTLTVDPGRMRLLGERLMQARLEARQNA